MKFNLSDNLASRQDLKETILEIRRYAQWVAQGAIKKRLVGDDSAEPPVISQAAKDIIKQWEEGDTAAPKGLGQLVEALEEFESTASYISLTLAAPPPPSLKKTLVQWCRQNIDPNILVDFQFNSTILGGLVARYGSHVYDWSFRRQILAARDRFPEVLRHV
jgi:hypothetical protein